MISSLPHLMHIVLLTCSVAGNGLLLYKLFQERKRNDPKEKDLKLMADLMSGGNCLIKITRIAPEEYFVRSPR